LKPLRIAFDHLGVKAPYEKAIRIAHEFGLDELSNYMLYNFHDDPADLFQRMRLNVSLNEELGVRIWSFPMRYQPTDRIDRGHIGDKWTRYQLRSMQIILQATHGIVSGEPTFFKRAFGDTVADFERILLLPHDFIFNRDWYERFDSEGQLHEHQAEFERLKGFECRELLTLLSSCDPRDYSGLVALASTPNVKKILRFYLPLPKARLFEIWARQKELVAGQASVPSLPDDELVEDAGLQAEEHEAIPAETKRRQKVAA
jgi:hypothetical protein